MFFLKYLSLHIRLCCIYFPTQSIILHLPKRFIRIKFCFCPCMFTILESANVIQKAACTWCWNKQNYKLLTFTTFREFIQEGNIPHSAKDFSLKYFRKFSLLHHLLNNFKPLWNLVYLKYLDKESLEYSSTVCLKICVSTMNRLFQKATSHQS